MTSAPKTGKQWPKTTLLGVRQHTEALKGQMKRDTSMRQRRGCSENKTQHYHQCHPVLPVLAAARTATQESAFTATVDAAKILQIDNGAHQHRLFVTTLCLYSIEYKQYKHYQLWVLTTYLGNKLFDCTMDNPLHACTLLPSNVTLMGTSLNGK